MTTLFHAYHTRSSALVTLVNELGAQIEIRDVSIPRLDGKGGRDPANPHPEGKVPYLTDGAESLHERGAIMLYLTDKFPKAGMGPLAGEAGRGAYLSWLSYYQGVMEPVILLKMSGLSHPYFDAALRDFDTMMARLTEVLKQGPWLLGERYSAADILCSSPFGWLPSLLEGYPTIHAWVERCNARPAAAAAMARDAEQAARAA
ncbi:glutathione S-transferase family protein [Pararhodobacter zhoushanensis]|uniref:Glutathione S-transferase family protein n=1 Tax=Pararhodobacter zhoushanensis TaxID=2479545 RepID=A0ABT3GVP4_9RHOB|nr:glutathione S-transferase family protein [Pararhodobacter zhoushanensis]MCW1931603.1 glutathione S-transferase family protein [Pararhodobacter zhoushanensis]